MHVLGPIRNTSKKINRQNRQCAYISCRDTFSWFVDETFTEKIEGIGRSCCEQIAHGGFWKLSNCDVVWKFSVTLKKDLPTDQHVGERTYWPLVFGRRPQRSEDSFELIHIALSREVGNPKHEFGKDTPHRPDINT